MRDMEPNGSTCTATNDTFGSCWNKSVQCAAFQSPISSFLPGVQTFLLSIYFVFGLILNSFVVFLILRYEVLRRREFALVLQVVAADLISVTCFFPVVIITRPTGLWSSLGPSWCSVLGFIQLFFTSFRYTAMFLLSFDRFNMVFFPFTYPLHGNKIMVPLTVLVWIVSVLMAIIPLFIQCYSFQLPNGFCTVSSSCSQVCYAYRLLLDSVSYIAGAMAPIILYSLMYLRSVQLKKKVAIMESEAAADESNRRARGTFLLLFVSLMGCSLPELANFILLPLKSSHAEVYWDYRGLSVTALYTVVILDPLVIMKHQDMKNCAKKFLQSLKQWFQTRLHDAGIENCYEDASS